MQHRWLDESAPIKLSPLLAAQNALLGPEPDFLDLNAGPPQAKQPVESGPPASPLDVLSTGAAELQPQAPAKTPNNQIPARTGASTHRRKAKGRGHKRKQVCDHVAFCEGFLLQLV